MSVVDFGTCDIYGLAFRHKTYSCKQLIKSHYPNSAKELAHFLLDFGKHWIMITSYGFEFLLKCEKLKNQRIETTRRCGSHILMFLPEKEKIYELFRF